MSYRIVMIDGDGIGPELIHIAVRVLDKVGRSFGRSFDLETAYAGDAALETFGTVFPEASAALCREADGILFGGFLKIDKKYSHLPREQRPNTLGTMLKELQYETNIRSIRIYPALKDISSLRADLAEKGMDIIVVRDMLGGMTKSKHYMGTCEFGRDACDYEYYHEQMIRPTVIRAFEIARQRSGKLTHICKKVGIRSALLWVDVVNEIKADYPDVKLEHVNADDSAMLLAQDPTGFDVIVGANTYCDIISDQLAGMMGVPRILAAANIMRSGKGLFERNLFTETAFEEVGKDSYNPLGMINATAMLLKYSLRLDQEAASIDRAVESVLADGLATRDFLRGGRRETGMNALAEEVIRRIE